jgi:hypothetical protein
MMNFLKSLDVISPPYSTIASLAIVSCLGVSLIFWGEPLRVLGVGIIAGGYMSIALKAAAEASDHETWQRIQRLFGKKG